MRRLRRDPADRDGNGLRPRRQILRQGRIDLIQRGIARRQTAEQNSCRLLADGNGRRRFRGRERRGQSRPAARGLIVDGSESVGVQDHGLPGVRRMVCIDGLEAEILRDNIPGDFKERRRKIGQPDRDQLTDTGPGHDLDFHRALPLQLPGHLKVDLPRTREYEMSRFADSVLIGCPQLGPVQRQLPAIVAPHGRERSLRVEDLPGSICTGWRSPEPGSPKRRETLTRSIEPS